MPAQSKLKTYDVANREAALLILANPAKHAGIQLEWALLQKTKNHKTGGIPPEKEEPHMPIYAKAGASFVPAPAGTHIGVCVDVIDHGLLEVTFQNKTQRKHKITIVWQIAENMDDGRPFLVRRRFTCSLHEKAALRASLESWRGRAFSNAELQNFDVETLLAVPCLINIVHQATNGSTFANVSSIMKLPKGMTAPQPRDYIRVCDRPAAQTDGAEDGLGVDDSDIPF